MLLRKTTIVVLAILLCLSPAVLLAKPVYKIGGIFSSTGRASFLGDPEKKTMEMMVEKINAAGGIDGHMLQAVIYDSEGDPAKAVSAVNKLIHKDKVLAIIGPSTTPTTLAIVNFVERAQLPLISCAAGVKITSPVKPWVFKTAQSDLLAVAAVYQHIQARGIKKIGIITVANSFGESGKNQLLAQAPDFGLEVVQAESFGAKDTDTTAQLTKIKSAAPEAIVCWGTNPGPAVVAKNVKQLKLDIPLYQSHGVASPKFIELAGDAAEGIILPTGKILVTGLLPEDDVQKKILEDYQVDYQAKYKGNVSGFGGYAFDAVNLLAKALKGSNGDKNKIRRALESMAHHVGATGEFNFSAQDHNGLAPSAFVMVEIKGGTWKLIK
ncbi:amino acid/amide ABC transporter substrate-binding protein, HAAT family [Desulfocicer vacuolatum DSM 3385]|uniref:Amino acid/amide ABC transporter substrate-binding protein, HAAT family n=1 Tax=Desulfocicer vacuolatum DSM 3385 TaxID=1121400 RepID=A0A1W2DK92_9BACT|nr:ABC transporter substrate-binding protein [Desulfocicer vacuolatum]SMC97502.1 amino acid/amide ABC transporter substrate-binding protein, HAAT family [Desulfocicer vacuolatum DSM 3385]